MIGLVFYNAFLRYVFSSSYPPSEEWARFLFIYITFFGAIEAFYRNKHIAVDMFVVLLKGAPRKYVDITASLCSRASGRSLMVFALIKALIFFKPSFATLGSKIFLGRKRKCNKNASL